MGRRRTERRSSPAPDGLGLTSLPDSVTNVRDFPGEPALNPETLGRAGDNHLILPRPHFGLFFVPLIFRALLYARRGKVPSVEERCPLSHARPFRCES